VNAWILLPMSLSRCSLHLPRLCILFFELLSLHKLPFHLATEPPQTLPLPAAKTMLKLQLGHLHSHPICLPSLCKLSLHLPSLRPPEMVGQDGIDTSKSLASMTTNGQDHNDALAEPPLPASLPSGGSCFNHLYLSCVLETGPWLNSLCNAHLPQMHEYIRVLHQSVNIHLAT
jgi:hypothetical protein